MSKQTVTMRALLQRINRKLKTEDQLLRTSRGSEGNELGTFYALDFTRNVVVAKHVNPVEWGRELGVLASCERVADE
jgi:hypothetical protein